MDNQIDLEKKDLKEEALEAIFPKQKNAYNASVQSISKRFCCKVSFQLFFHYN